MMSFFDEIGPAIWRASWQAAVLAVVIALVLRLLGDRVTPRWRYLFLSVVVVRLLLVVTPASPWSIFNLSPAEPAKLAATDQEPHGRATAFANSAASPASSSRPAPDATVDELATGESGIHPFSADPATEALVETVPATAPADLVQHPSADATWTASRVLTLIWFVVCTVFVTRTAWATIVLRQRLRACVPVADTAILKLLDTIRVRLGLRRCPALLVTPGAMSPCVAGAWRPTVIVPEAMLAPRRREELRQVLAHELAHVARGDVWTNWLLLAARTIHWFNPLAWWTIRQMQIERESACDELVLAKLGESERTTYAKALLDVAAEMSPTPIAPGTIGIFSSKRSLEKRLKRIVSAPSVLPLRWVVIAGLLLAVALVGLTDTMPAVVAENPQGQRSSDANDATPSASADVIHADEEPLRAFVGRSSVISQSLLNELLDGGTAFRGREFDSATIVDPDAPLSVPEWESDSASLSGTLSGLPFSLPNSDGLISDDNAASNTKSASDTLTIVADPNSSALADAPPVIRKRSGGDQSPKRAQHNRPPNNRVSTIRSFVGIEPESTLGFVWFNDDENNTEHTANQIPRATIRSFAVNAPSDVIAHSNKISIVTDSGSSVFADAIPDASRQREDDTQRQSAGESRQRNEEPLARFEPLPGAPTYPEGIPWRTFLGWDSDAGDGDGSPPAKEPDEKREGESDSDNTDARVDGEIKFTGGTNQEYSPIRDDSKNTNDDRNHDSPTEEENGTAP